ncbi:MAG: hypothetical protein FWH21_07095, partial [Kiritimatiellaeota bacterium]|nr:hypothetical protein [Kiritimatiellota bacterium]
YGICWNTAPKPTTAHNAFPLYHRDRYDAQILGLRPNTTYYARAYAQSALGVKYSDNEVTFTTPPAGPLGESVEPLLNDRFDNNWHIQRYHGTATDGNGWHLGSGASVFLLKLMTYYRAPITGDNPRNIKLDFTRIHTNPSQSRPGFRLSDFDAAFGFCNGLAGRARMKQARWDSKDEKEFAKQLGLKPGAGMRDTPLIPVERTTPLEPLVERARQTLYAESRPVVLIQEYDAQTPTSFGIGFIIIDGYRNGDEFHFCFPEGKNRNLPNFPTGWYKFDSLLWKDVNRNFLVFDLAPGKTGTVPQSLDSIRR